MKPNPLTSFTVLLPGSTSPISGLTLRVPRADEHLSHEALLEKIFAWFNHGSGSECDMFLSGKSRSLSVNDFVCIDGLWWQCESVGWTRCAASYVQEICNDVKECPNLAKYGAFACLQDIMWKRKKNR